MEHPEIEKSKSFIMVEIVEYLANSILIKTIQKKSTGNVLAMSIDSGEGLTEKISPFDTFVQVIDGNVEVVIGGNKNHLTTGQSIVIPAHAMSYSLPNGRFKMANMRNATRYTSH